MRILFANKFFFLNGGSERVFFQEREFLLGKKYSVIDFSMKDDRNFASPYSNYFVPNINYQRSSSQAKRISKIVSFIHSNVAVNKVEKLIKDIKPDIAHLHNIYHQLTPSIIPALKNNGIKVVLTLHDYKLICPNYIALNNNEICLECQGKHFMKAFYYNCRNAKLQSFLLSAEAIWHKWKGSYDLVDLFIAPSQFLAEKISMRIPESKILVLNNGIETDEYLPNYKDEGYCLYFGRISEEKGIHTLLKAYNVKHNLLPLKIIGAGPLVESLQAENLSAEFLGYKTGEELKNLISNAAFVVVPSEWYENCSMVVLEAMAFGKPIIGSNIGGIPEQVEDGRTGFLFKMGNTEDLAKKMHILSTNKELRIKMGKASRKRIEDEYTLETHCSKLINIYEELLVN